MSASESTAAKARLELVGCKVDMAFLKTIDEARETLKLSRSAFLREAVEEKLQRLGYDVAAIIPDRAGVGGRPRKAAALSVPASVILNETPGASLPLPPLPPVAEIPYVIKPRTKTKTKP